MGAGFTWAVGETSVTELLGGNGRSISDNGRIAGWATPSTGITEAAYWPNRSSGPTLLGTLGGVSSMANAVNDSGTVVGWAQTSSGARHAFMWTSSEGMVDLGTLPGDTTSEAHDINSAGLIVGKSDNTPVIWDPANTFDPDYPPEIEPIPAQSVAAGETLMVDPIVKDPDGDAYTANWDLPPGATPLGDGFEWTPTTADIGTHIVFVTVTQDSAPSNSAMSGLVIEVTEPVATPPLLDPIDDMTVVARDQLTFTAHATSSSPGTLSFRLHGATMTDPPPTGASIDSSSGQFSWTPDPTQVGSHDITVGVSDEHGADAASFAVTVEEPPPPPPPSVEINVVEAIDVGDSPLVQPAIAVLVREDVIVGDLPILSGPLQIIVIETVAVTDDVGVNPPLEILVLESLAVADDVALSPSIFISVGETITVDDQPSVDPGLLIEVTETVGVVDEVTVELVNAVGSISGLVWEDTDGDGTRDSGEPGLPGATIYSDLNDNGVHDLGEPIVLSATDDPNTLALETGHYLLPDLEPGTHVVRQIPPAGHTQTHPADQGPNVVSLEPFVEVGGIDFGDRPPSDQAPLIEPIDPILVDEGTELTVIPQIVDPEDDPYTIIWDGVPEGAVINGIFIWTPSETEGPGEYQVTVTAIQDSDPSLSSSHTFTILVAEVDGPDVEVPINPGTIGASSAQPGDPVVVQGTGYLPGTDASVVMYSDPVTLATVLVGPDGDFETTVIIPNDTEPGLHRIVVVGLEAPDDGLVLQSWIVIVPRDDHCTIVGTPGNDWLFGTAEDDVICGLGGHDRIFGLGGNDILVGGSGRDSLFGGSGDDIITGGEGRDLLFGMRGNDVLVGGPGRDVLTGGRDHDTFVDSSGDWVLDARTGDVIRP